MKKRLLVGIISLAMMVSMTPAAACPAFAQEGGAAAGAGHAGYQVSSDIGEVFDQLEPSADPYNYTSEDLMAQEEAAIYPSSFDLRNVDGKNYVTNVKFQNPFGTCWGFAAIAAAETSLLGSGLAQEDGYDVNNFDLSEKHLTYFAATALNDPGNPQDGEGCHTHGATASQRLNYGGLPFMATSLFSSGIGPNLENRDDSFVYKGRQGLTQKIKLNGKYTDYCYSDEDDWSLDESKRFKQSYVLKESYMLPSPAIIINDDKLNDDIYQYNEAGTNAIKKQLMNKRAVQIGYHCSVGTGIETSTGDPNFLSENYAHYTYLFTGANHAVTIVGWDDNYPVSNFNQGTAKDDRGELVNAYPPHDGAWLVKNSWGSGEEEFPNFGRGDWGYVNSDGVHTGYFWLSYYDKSIDMPEALSFDKSNVGRSYELNQHDYMPVNEVYGATDDSEIKEANVFTAESNQRLEQISCETTYPGTKVHYEVYILPDEFATPDQGELKVSGDAGAYEFGGYHKIELPTPVVIGKGQKYSIIETLTTPDQKYAVNIPIGYGSEPPKDNKEDYWLKGIINKNESFLSMGGKWYDCDGMQRQLAKRVDSKTYKELAVDNLPIRGYSAKLPNLDINVIWNHEPITQLRSVIDKEGPLEEELSVDFTGDQGVLPDPSAKVEWKVGTGTQSDGVTIVPDAKDDSVATLTATRCADTDLFVTVGNLSKVVPIKVQPAIPTLKSVKAGKGKLTISTDDLKAIGISGYQVMYRVKGKKQWKTKDFGPNKPKMVLKSVKKGKKYQVKVKAFYTSEKGNTLYGGTGGIKTSKKVK